MLKKRLLSLLKILFWSSPLIFWLGWQLVLLWPTTLWLLLVGSLLLLAGWTYEVVDYRIGWRWLFVLAEPALLASSFYLFISLLASTWLIQFLWLLLVLYLYRYFRSARLIVQSRDKEEWSQTVLYGGLVTVFLASASLFGLQAFLSLSPWPLLAALLVVLLINTRTIAYAQGWNGTDELWLWPSLSLLVAEIAMMLSLMPLNYLIAGILSALAYYSAINFLRLYLTNKLSGRKIRNYAWFTAVSLAIILLTARWL